MECGVPFCHNGCPLGNLIPDWNDLVYRERWSAAIEQLHATNNFPEFTGRLCPAPCEAACVLEIREGDAVTIKQIEQAIIDRAWKRGVGQAAATAPRDRASGRRHRLRARRHGGRPAASPRRASRRPLRARRGGRRARALRRPRLQDREVDRPAARAAARRRRRRAALRRRRRQGRGRAGAARAFDAIVIATGSRVPRDLPVPGRELGGIHFAMDYLYQRNRFVARELGPAPDAPAPQAPSEITAAGKHVVVIGGGDTGADCVGNAVREDATSVVQLELLPEPPTKRPDERTPWPEWPLKLRLSYAMDEALTLAAGRAGLLDHDDQAQRRRGRCGRRAAHRAGKPRAAVRARSRYRARAARAARVARDGLPRTRDRRCSTSSEWSATSART